MWVNPTDNLIRGCDSRGCGNYGANRGDRSHLGVDYIAVPDQAIKAVKSGVVTYIGYTYSDDLSFRYIAIRTNEGYIIRHLYVLPFVQVGDTVDAGDVIGSYQSLALRYPGITEHVHVDVWADNGTQRPWATGAMSINPTKLIPLPRQPVQSAAPLREENNKSTGFITIGTVTTLAAIVVGAQLMGVF